MTAVDDKYSENSLNFREKACYILCEMPAETENGISVTLPVIN